MGDAVMELGEKELEKIGAYVRSHLEEWSREQPYSGYRTNREIELLERMVRVEEGLKNVVEQMQTGFSYIEKRFEEVDKRFEQVDKRFEQVDKRFEQVDKRFEQVDKRFSQLQWTMGLGFTIMAALMGVLKIF